MQKEKIDNNYNKNAKPICSTCLRVIDNEPFAFCVKCKGFLQCLNCLNEGIEKDNHIREHPFIIVTERPSSLFRRDWSCFEEMIFLDAIERLGLNNFPDIENLILFKNRSEYESHYKSVYLKSQQCPKPEITLKDPDPPQPSPNFSTEPEFSFPSDRTDEVVDRMNQGFEITPGEQAGYMPRRKEFEIEYMDNFECVLNGLEFFENETNQSFVEKMNRLLAYQSVIEERELRTRAAIDFKLYDAKYRIPNKSSPASKEITKTMLTLGPYIGSKAMEIIELAEEKVSKESLIHSRLEWESKGVETIKEGILFNKFNNIIEKRELTKTDKNKWKALVEEHNKLNSNDESEMSLLLEKEERFCTKNGLDIKLYLVLKDLVIREFSYRGELSKEECISLDPSHKHELEQMYDLFVRVGWICS